MATILVKLALALIAKRIDPTDPATIIAFVAELGRVVRPEDVARIWSFVTETADQIRALQAKHPAHSEEQLAQTWLDSDGVEHPISTMEFGDPDNPGGGPTGGEG